MVDDERGQIGTYRALGYTNGRIMAKYLIYSGSSAFLGCVIGFFGGSYLFPYVISEAYKMLYDFGTGIDFYFFTRTSGNLPDRVAALLNGNGIPCLHQ